MRFINFNGQIQSENVPVIHGWNRSFRYGDGLFESMAIGEKSIPFLDDHWNRLVKGAQFLSLELPEFFTKSTLQKTIFELLPLNGIKGNAYARVMLYRDGKGRYTPDAMVAGYMIEVEPIEGELFALNKKGLTIGLYTNITKPIDQLSNFKTNSALIYVLASIQKTKEGWDDCLVLNTRSNICDSTNSNVFLVKDKAILTPSLREGCVEGVMRKQVMALAEQKSFTIRETAIETEMLRQADEVFLTNAVAGIKWVQQYGNKQYNNFTSVLLSDALRKQGA